MGLFEQSEAKKRANEIKKEGREVRKALLSAGLDKKLADSFLDEFTECLKDACALKENYQNAREHMQTCRMQIEQVVPRMRELSTETCKAELTTLLAELQLVYHDCSIREDDLDFDTTIQYLKKTVPGYSENDRLLMQSELENLKAVLDDAFTWEAPDFMALAYFLRHDRKDLLADMENSQRNRYIQEKYKEQFWNEKEESLQNIGMLERLNSFKERFLHAII